jgi:hypothetical protein
MDGVPLAARRDELKCGVAVVDLASGHAGGGVCGMLEFQTAVEEIFDVQLLGGFQFPEVMGFHKDTLGHTFIVPDPTVSLQDNWAGGRKRDDYNLIGNTTAAPKRGAPKRGQVSIAQRLAGTR